MKKTILKTALITLGVTMILVIAAFGIMSFCAPKAMMKFTASLGMESISGDYAYQEYERSGDMDCLARSFVIAAENKDNRAANERFGQFYGQEGSERRSEFETFCAEYKVEPVQGGVSVSYRNYILGLASCVKYRLAKTADARTEACDFALSQTAEFTADSPAVALALETVSEKDKEFAELYLGKIREKKFEQNKTYTDIVKFLEATINE